MQEIDEKSPISFLNFELYSQGMGETMEKRSPFSVQDSIDKDLVSASKILDQCLLWNFQTCMVLLNVNDHSEAL